MRLLILGPVLALVACAEFGMPLTEHPTLPADTARQIVDLDCPDLRLVGHAIDAVGDGAVPPEDLSAEHRALFDLVKDLSPEQLAEADDLARTERREKRCRVLLGG